MCTGTDANSNSFKWSISKIEQIPATVGKDAAEARIRNVSRIRF